MADVATSASTVGRRAEVRLLIWIELVTVAWMPISATVALLIGFTAHSVSLQGFGIDSVEALHEARTGETCSCGEDDCSDGD